VSEVRVGDLVEYRPFMSTGAQGLGIVVEIAKTWQLNDSGEPMAEVLWTKYPHDGPQWYMVKNLCVVVQCE